MNLEILIKKDEEIHTQQTVTIGNWCRYNNIEVNFKADKHY